MLPLLSVAPLLVKVVEVEPVSVAGAVIVQAITVVGNRCRMEIRPALLAVLQKAQTIFEAER